MIPLRERIVRKAKEKAVESLHELTTNQNNRSLNTDKTVNNSSSLANGKRNNRSYKPFSEQNQISEEEHSEEEHENTPKKTPRVGRKPLQTTTTATKTKSNTKSRKETTLTNLETSDSDNSTNLLFNQVFSAQVSTQTIVDDWIELYKKDRQTAMLDLIKFIVRSSGCKSAHMLSNKEILRTKEFAECINDLIDHFTDDDDPTSGEVYPLIQNSVQARRFKSNFSEFLQLLINQCQYSIIYDQYMLDILITFLIALADSQVRAFRHTATLAVLKVMTALVDVLLSLSVLKDANQRQYNNEKQKSQVKRAHDRLELLTNKRKEIEENEEEIQNFINFIFKAVFIHRYRDMCPDIRCVCINEIGEWMKKCPSKFLDDTFLKYIGWTLYDKIGECRLKCLQALQPLYDDENLVSKLELFTSRFKNRMVEMSLDKESDVCVAAIRLLTEIITKNDSALEDRDCENLYELVYHSNRQIAQAAGEFLNQKLFVKIENPVIEFRRGKKQSENSNFIQLLVQFLIESELHDHPTYLVDAMWDTHPMLKDWQCMTDLLLEDPVNQEDVLSDTHERYLVEIMNCCVRQAATGEYPVARRQGNRKLTTKELKQIQDDKIVLTQHFIQFLPDLLNKFIADSEKLVFLLEIPNFFDLNQYTLRRQEKNLERLLKLIQEIVNKHNDSEVLEKSSLCLSYLCDEDQGIYSKCNVIRSSILDDLVQKFNEAMQKFEELTEVDETEMFPLIISLKRLSAFAEHHNIVNYDIINNTFTVLKWAVFNEGFNLDFVNKAMNLARSFICWNLNKLDLEMETRDPDASINQALIDYVSKISKKYYKICNKLFVNDNPNIEEEAYFELCDLLIMFNVNLGKLHDGLYKPLVLECSVNEINLLSVFVMNNSFTPEALVEKADTAENIEKLHKRRSILAAFCKLISYNCVPIKYAAEIFRGYSKFSNLYNDIIKSLLGNCREISKVNTARTIALALQREYIEAINTLQNKSNESVAKLTRSAPEFSGLKELARKFSLSFGPEASVKSREAIMTIHQEAIQYASEPPARGNQAPGNLPFLEVVIDFSYRLSAQDKKNILNELDKMFAKRANKIEENNWHPYYTYRMSLMEDSGALEKAQNVQNVQNEQSLTNLTEQENLTPGKLNRKRKLNNSINVSSGSRLRQSLNFERSRQIDKTIPEIEENDDENYEQNSHVDSTTNELEILKLSSIQKSGGRITRSGALMEKNLGKRSRSPLVSNNSINESTDQNTILSSTRIGEPKVTAFRKKLRSSIGISAIGDVDEDDLQSPAKRNRKSDENEKNENSLIHA